VVDPALKDAKPKDQRIVPSDYAMIIQPSNIPSQEASSSIYEIKTINSRNKSYEYLS